MTFINMSIRRPILAAVLSLFIVLTGLKSFNSLEWRQYPEVIFPVVKITTTHPGASENLVRELVTTPVLNTMTGIDGVNYLSAESGEGISSVSVFLTQGYDVDAALLDISTKLDKVQRDLPKQSGVPFVEKQQSVETDALQYLAYSSRDLSEAQITDYVRKVIVPKLSAIEGISAVDLMGDKETLLQLRDVTRVELGTKNDLETIHYSGVRSVLLRTRAATTANSIEVAERVRNLLPQLQAQLPSMITMELLFDTTDRAKTAIDEVLTNLIEACVIVVVVLFLFLGSLRAVIVPVITIALSLMGVLSLMLQLDFSVNLLTLLAMVLAVGLVVDGTIVVMENTQRYINEGVSRFDAALQGAQDMAYPVIVMATTLAVVYLPIVFLDGLTGVLFTEFAFTLAGAVIASAVIALTLSPVMCSRLLGRRRSEYVLMQRIGHWLAQLNIRYQETLHCVLSYREASLLFFFAIFISLFYLYPKVSQELAPQEDGGVVYIQGKVPQSSSLQYIEKYIKQIEPVLEKLPERERGGVMLQQNGFFSLQMLVPWDQRERSGGYVANELLAELSNVTGLQVFTFNRSSLPGATNGLPIQWVLMSSASDDVINQVRSDVVAEIKSSGLFTFVEQGMWSASADRLDQFYPLNSTTINAALAPGVTLGEAVDYLNHLAEKKLPEDFSHDYIGQARQFREESRALTAVYIFSVALVYLVLLAQFKNFRDPVVVLVTVPMSICGALIPIALGLATLNIYTQIALVTLIGLISKHGILIVDFANKLQGMGLDPYEAVERAAVIRLRPVLMTTATIVFAVVPLVWASGAQALNDVGWVIAAGMLIGTLFSLYIVPTLYTFVARSRGAEPHFLGVMDEEPASSEVLSGGEIL